MKKLSFFLLLLFAACNNKQNQNTQNNTPPPIIEAIGTQISADSLKPPVVKPAGKPTVFQIPTTPGSSYIGKYSYGEERKIILVPPSTYPLAIWQAQGSCNFTTFTSDQGLALDAIRSGFKDCKGNLWFGTYGGGVSRYDGKSFTNFTTAQGLANNNILSITQDSKGNFWFGTDHGVSRYDGKSFINYTTAQGLANNIVSSITQDSKGDLWFGTNGGGVSRYDTSAALRRGGKSFTNFTTAQGLANNNISSITEDSKGNLWFGTYGGVSRYDPSTQLSGSKFFTNFTTAQGLANNTVLSIIQDSKGNLWFATVDGGVSRYDPSAVLRAGEKSFTNFTAEQGLASNTVLSISQDSKGSLWFGTDGKGVSRYDPSATLTPGGKSFTNFTTEQGLANNTVLSITQDSQGNLWFGTYGGGVSRYDGKSFTNFLTNQKGLANSTVRSISKDSEGDLWFATDGGGVSRYDGKSFTNFTTAQGLASNTVSSITQGNKEIWFGTVGEGVSRYDGKSFTNFTTEQGLANNTVLSITQDSKGYLWFATDGGGVSRYDPSASLRTSGIFTNFTTAQGLANNTVFSITQDSKGNLWFGTDGGGVSRYDPSTPLRAGSKPFTNFTTAQGLANNTVLSITEDKTANLWFGTYGGGVSRYDGKSFMNFTTAQGLPDNIVTQVVITKEQNIAIGTNLGVTVLTGFVIANGVKQSHSGNKIASTMKNGSRNDMIPAENSLSNEELRNYKPVIEIYNSSTGYPVKDVNVGPNCMFVDSDGIIWAGTGSDKTGLVRFDYAALLRNTEPPTVVIQAVKIDNENICWYSQSSKYQVSGSKTKNDSASNLTGFGNLSGLDSATLLLAQFNAFGKTVPQTILDSQRTKFSGIQFDDITKFYPLPQHLVLPYEHNNVSFEFNAIETGRPFLVNYQYILEGYDKEWSPVTKKTSATFGNIYEGTYTFKLKAQSPEGVWSEPVIYTFKVLPPWFRTWWMYMVYGILALTLVVFIVWWNGRRLRTKAKELTEEIRKATETIVEKSKVVEEQKIIVEAQKIIVEEKNKDITDSITYAKRIQHAMLPHLKDIQKAFPESFVLFKPKDIVSGDFYFFHKKPTSFWGGSGGANFFIAAADCTGHGVPGAFMSMIGSGKLNDAVHESSDTSEILSLLNKGIKTVLKQSESSDSTRDGMDIALCSVDTETGIVKYAAANRPIWIIRASTTPALNGSEGLSTGGQTEVEEIKATKKAIGGFTEGKQHFETHEIQLQKGDTFYLSTDGYADTFSGKDNKKLTTKKFKQILIDIQNKSMKEQEKYLDNFVENWKAGTEQVDDILVIGIRL